MSHRVGALYISCIIIIISVVVEVAVVVVVAQSTKYSRRRFSIISEYAFPRVSYYSSYDDKMMIIFVINRIFFLNGNDDSYISYQSGRLHSWESSVSKRCVASSVRRVSTRLLRPFNLTWDSTEKEEGDGGGRRGGGLRKFAL